VEKIMHFLIDEDLPRSIKDLLQRYGHEGVDLRLIGFQGSKDHQIAALAQSRKLCLVTGDFDFSNIRNYPPGKYAGIVVLRVPRTATASHIVNLFESFLRQEELVTQIPGKLAIVEPGRIRVRTG
jgi:predicted nuclease of predicted toxin-antitoxin system